jgi:hypothetical protein
MKQPEGQHGREMCSLVWVVKYEGERELEIRICCVVEKPKK